MRNKKGRFIPVCTGNILLNIKTAFVVPVYPCVYREHLNEIDEDKFSNGLSLCVQGTLNNKSFMPLFSRFIPVCTGNIT